MDFMIYVGLWYGIATLYSFPSSFSLWGGRQTNFALENEQKCCGGEEIIKRMNVRTTSIKEVLL